MHQFLINFHYQISQTSTYGFLHFSSLGLPIQPPRWYSQPICLAKQSGIPASDAASGKNSKNCAALGIRQPSLQLITSNPHNTHLMILHRATAGLTDTPTHLYLAVLFFHANTLLHSLTIQNNL